MHALARETRIPEASLVAACRKVYAEASSLEYPGLVQRLPKYLPEIASANLEQLTQLAVTVFGSVRRHRLRLYDGVASTLDWLRSNGYLIVLYSDGPIFYNREKFRHLGLRRHVDGVVAWAPSPADLPAEPGIDDSHLHRHWFSSSAAKPSGIPELLVSAKDKKPNPAVLMSIIETFAIDPDATWVVGDSLEKDLAPAAELGLTTIWARYGRDYDQENWKTLVDVSPWRPSVIQAESSNVINTEPTFIVDSFTQLQSLLPAYQLGLF